MNATRLIEGSEGSVGSSPQGRAGGGRAGHRPDAAIGSRAAPPPAGADGVLRGHRPVHQPDSSLHLSRERLLSGRTEGGDLPLLAALDRWGAHPPTLPVCDLRPPGTSRPWFDYVARRRGRAITSSRTCER